MKESPDTTRVLIHGASGRMGQALLRLIAAERPDLRAVAAVSGSKPSQRVIDGLPYFAASELHGVPAFDVAIDFSLPDGLESILALCVERGMPLVSGTTGLDDSQGRALDAASRTVPVLLAANFSLGVTVLGDLVERAAALLQAWDCDIIESHHKHKVDAPSGTALALGARAEQGEAKPRYASLRAGDIVGEHTVQFTGPGERIELVHRASNRDVFARGALHAAAWLADQDPGRYQLRDMLL